MVSVLVSKTLRGAAALTIAAAIQMAVMASSAHALAIYDYFGKDFTTVSSPTFTTNDFITGFVEFGSQPAPGDTDVTNVIAFSFTAGDLTITSDSAGVVSSFFFDFDLASPRPDILNWNWAVDIPFGPGLSLESCSTGSSPVSGCPTDRAFIGLFGGVNASDPGTWTKRAAQVPEPGTLWLLLMGLAALVLAQALGRRRGRPARA